MDYVLYVIPVMSAVFIAGAGYFRDTPLEVFNPTKFAATVAVGAFIGVISVQTASPITEQWVGIQLVAYAGMISLVENTLKAIWRRIYGS